MGICNSYELHQVPIPHGYLPQGYPKIHNNSLRRSQTAAKLWLGSRLPLGGEAKLLEEGILTTLVSNSSLWPVSTEDNRLIG